MKYIRDEQNNFCRVFELPETYPEDFCFDGGKLTPFLMVDWFNPIPSDVEEIEHDDLVNLLTPFISGKCYVKRGRKYLIVCDFGAAIIVEL